LEDFIKVAEEDNKIKYKRIKIEFGKKSSDYIITEDITNVPESEYDKDITFYSFEQLQEKVQDDFNLNMLPEFYLKNDITKIVKDSKGFLNTNGSIFVENV
jgi:hypothetical protein